MDDVNAEVARKREEIQRQEAAEADAAKAAAARKREEAERAVVMADALRCLIQLLQESVPPEEGSWFRVNRRCDWTTGRYEVTEMPEQKAGLNLLGKRRSGWHRQAWKLGQFEHTDRHGGHYDTTSIESNYITDQGWVVPFGSHPRYAIALDELSNDQHEATISAIEALDFSLPEHIVWTLAHYSLTWPSDGPDFMSASWR